MEDFPLPPAESPKQPDKSGGEETTKKKKKTTRIPLPAKTEPIEFGASPERRDTRARLEGLFAKAGESDEAKKAEVSTEAKSKTGLELPEVETTSEKAHDTEYDEAPQEDQDSREAKTIEDEFAEDAPFIITRGERQETAPDAIIPQNEESDETVIETSASAEEISEPFETEDEVEPSSVDEPEITTTEVVEAVSHPEEVAPEVAPPIFTPVSRPEERMIDPSALAESGGSFERAVSEPKKKEETYNYEDVRHAEKRGLGRGVASGGLAGLWLGHRWGRRKAEHEANVELKKRDKKIDRLETSQRFTDQELTRVRRKSEEMSRPLAAERVATVNAAIEQLPVSMQEAPLQAGNKPSAKAESIAGRPLSPTATLEAAAHDKRAQQPEIAPEDREITEDTYRTPEGRRVEMSAWHRFEVDAKTGKLIENPEIAYGEEFNREQRQEKLQWQATQPHVAAQVGQTVLHNNSQSTQTAINTNLAAAKSRLTLPQRLSKNPIANQILQQTTKPATWVIALGLVVLLFIVGILR